MEKKFVIDEAAIEKAAKELVAELTEREALAKKLVSTSDYILWLQDFTSSHPSFCDDEWKYFPEQLEPENLSNVTLLSHFIEGIEMYAVSSDKETDEFGYSVRIRFGNIGYILGIQHGQGTYHYCKRCEIFHNKSDFLDFNEIMKKANSNIIAYQRTE